MEQSRPASHEQCTFLFLFVAVCAATLYEDPVYHSIAIAIHWFSPEILSIRATVSTVCLPSVRARFPGTERAWASSFLVLLFAAHWLLGKDLFFAVALTYAAIRRVLQMPQLPPLIMILLLAIDIMRKSDRVLQTIYPRGASTWQLLAVGSLCTLHMPTYP